MRKFLQKIHGLPEDTRKFFAGLCMLAAGIAFFMLWTSSVPSRLVALTPRPAVGPIARQTAAVSGMAQAAPPAERESGALSPAAGIADTLRGFRGALSGAAASLGARIAGSAPQSAGRSPPPQGFFASVGQGLAAVAEAIYVKLAPWVPPY